MWVAGSSLAMSFRAQRDHPQMRIILRSRETCFLTSRRTNSRFPDCAQSFVERRTEFRSDWQVKGRSALRDLLHHQRGVLRSESYAVADGVLDLSFAAYVGYIVQVALGVGDVEVNGGGNLAVLHCDQGCRQ